MKKLLTLLLLIPIMCAGQNIKMGYGSLSSQVFLNHEFRDRFGINAAAGFSVTKMITAGASIDFFVFDKQESYIVPKADVRIFLPNPSQTSSYLSLQVGPTMPNKSTWDDQNISGGLAFDALIGGFLNFGKNPPGLNFAVGCSVINIENYREQSYVGAKVQFGFRF